MFENISLFLREIGEFSRLFSDKNRKARELVFYSERDIYFRYYEGYIGYIMDNSDADIAYITSDANDPILHTTNNRINPFYIKHLLPSTIRKLDSRALVMTMPDLDLFYVKRSINNVNHVYVFHGVGSIHLGYNKGAFDHYDTIFCIGPKDYEEMTRWEDHYNTKRKVLVQCGYPCIEKIYNDHHKFLGEEKTGDSIKLLIAPSWHNQNILEFCIDEIVEKLQNLPFSVIIRPHPEAIKRKSSLITQLEKKIKHIPNITLELDMLTATSIHESDILITDWSGIAFEYAYGTERPVLFINTPRRINNLDYNELGIEPLDFTIRNEIGLAIDRNQVSNIQGILHDFIANREKYRNKIIESRNNTLFNWMKASSIGGDYLLRLCKDNKNYEKDKRN